MTGLRSLFLPEWARKEEAISVGGADVRVVVELEREAVEVREGVRQLLGEGRRFSGTGLAPWGRRGVGNR